MKAWGGGSARVELAFCALLTLCATTVWGCGDGPEDTQIRSPQVPDAAVLPPTTDVTPPDHEDDAGAGDPG